MNGLPNFLPHWGLISVYAALFIGIIIEGPVLTAAGAFAASLGYLNIWIVFALSLVCNFIPDVVLYYIGYWGRNRIATTRLGHYLGVTQERLEQAEKYFEKHGGKTLLVSKILPLMAVPGLIAAGAVRMPIKKYTALSLAIIFPTSIFYLLLGYYLGNAYQVIAKNIEYSGYALLAILIIFLFIYYIYRKITEKLGNRLIK